MSAGRAFVDRSAARRCGDVLLSVPGGDTVVVGNVGPCADGSACGRSPRYTAEHNGRHSVAVCSRHLDALDDGTTQ